MCLIICMFVLVLLPVSKISLMGGLSTRETSLVKCSHCYNCCSSCFRESVEHLGSCCFVLLGF